MKITIPGRLDGLNEYTNANRTHRQKGAKLKKANEDIVLWAIKGHKIKTFENPVHIKITWIEPNRKRDKDNIAFAKKFVFDALVRGGVLKGDGWNHIDNFSDDFAVDKDNPRIEIEITEAIT